MKSGKKETAQLHTPPIPDHLLRRQPKRRVVVHLKLMGFSSLDSCTILPQDATVHTLETRVIAHHKGSISNVTLWKEKIEPQCILSNPSVTLKEAFQLNDETPHRIQFPLSAVGDLLARTGMSSGGTAAGHRVPSPGSAAGSTRGLAETILGDNSLGLGATGRPEDDSRDHHVIVYYDYTVIDTNDPLVLRSPQYPKAIMEPPGDGTEKVPPSTSTIV